MSSLQAPCVYESHYVGFPSPNIQIYLRQFSSYPLFLYITRKWNKCPSFSQRLPHYKKSQPLLCFFHIELLLSLPVAALSLSTGSPSSAYELNQGFQIVKGKKKKKKKFSLSPTHSSDFNPTFLIFLKATVLKAAIY